jgi:hypothetical protein
LGITAHPDLDELEDVVVAALEGVVISFSVAPLRLLRGRPLGGGGVRLSQQRGHPPGISVFHVPVREFRRHSSIAGWLRQWPSRSTMSAMVSAGNAMMSCDTIKYYQYGDVLHREKWNSFTK